MKITIEFDTKTDKINKHDKRILSSLMNDSGTYAHEQPAVDKQIVIDSKDDIASGSTAKPIEQLEEKLPEEVVEEGKKLADSLDSEGMPWDERIHASTKAKVQSGAWKKRRGVDPLTIAAVEKELRGETPTTEEQQGFELDDSGQVVPEETVEEETVNESMGFNDLLDNITPMIQANREFNNTINAILIEFGLTRLPELMSKPELIAPVYKRIQESWT